ncbi:unnamed protein product [Allacma fusca]|uniref:Uncharacterized protein n=1 Tax=Allacma fusca TaxID=39272 RepID=A0A8J2PZ08_9HEXA|nr:unnamed protein product [Allacma fusca]
MENKKTSSIVDLHCSAKNFGKNYTNNNEDSQSEYSETISIISFSDTDDELAEIEKKQYPDGLTGKEEAYRDIEKVFDELENEKLLDPFTRWRPKEDPPDVQTRPQFVPRRPSALPRRVNARNATENKTQEGKIRNPQKAPEVTGVASRTNVKSKTETASPTISSGNTLMKSNKISQLASPRRTIVAELIMEANEEEAKRKKAEALAKKALIPKAPGSTGSGEMPTAPGTKQPSPASSIITSFDDEESVVAHVGKSLPSNRDYFQSREEVIGDQPSDYIAAKKHTLVRDEYVRKRQLAVHRDIKTLQNISPLVTHPNDDDGNLNLSKVETGPDGITTTIPSYKTQYELRLAAATDNSSSSARETLLTTQELLIQDLAQAARKDSRKTNGQQKITSEDKTMFKIVYKEPRWPHQVTLDKMVDRLYKVKHLVLDDSQIMSLRDITSLLPSLIILSVKNCGLKTLDGTVAFPNLQKLFAADNELVHPAQCSMLSELQEMDLSGNPVTTFDGFEYLSVLHYLKVLKLYDTKISEERGFQLELRRLIPSLRDIYPKSKSMECDFDIDDDDYLSVDYKLLGKTEEELLKEQEMLKRAVHETSMITNTATITPPSSIRKWSQRINGLPGSEFSNSNTMKTSTDAELKLQSLISTVGDADADELDSLEKSGLNDFKKLYSFVNSSPKTTDDEQGHGDGTSEEISSAKEDFGIRGNTSMGSKSTSVESDSSNEADEN